jgi:hypothetical protein
MSYVRYDATRVRCSHCGTETTRQPEGDGCHACSRGVMRRVGA